MGGYVDEQFKKYGLSFPHVDDPHPELSAYDSTASEGML